MSLAATFIDADTLMVAADYTTYFDANRKVRADCGGDGYKYTVVTSATYSAPNTTVNLTADSDDLTSNLVSADWSVVKPGTSGNIPLHDHRDEDKGGLPFGWSTKPCNSKGNSFATVQAAIDDLAGDGWVFIPVGTWSETLVIDEHSVVLFGAGWASIVDGGTSGNAIAVTGEYCVARNLQCMTTAGSGNAYSAFYAEGADYIWVDNVYVSQSDSTGIRLESYALVTNCWVSTADATGIDVTNAAGRIIGCRVDNAGSYGIDLRGTADDSVVIGNIINTTGNDGILIQADAENCVVDGNRVTNWTNEAIDDDSGTSTIGDNDLT